MIPAFPAILSPPPGLAQDIPKNRLSRLLGYPSPDEFTQDSLRKLRSSRRWYEKHGDPYVCLRQCSVSLHPPDRVELCGPETSPSRQLHSSSVFTHLRGAEATQALIVVHGGGPALDRVFDAAWAPRPDRAFFLDRWGVAVVERLYSWTARSLQGIAAARGSSLLTPLAPGHGNWDVRDLPVLSGIFPMESSPFHALSSGALSPRHSMAVMFGLTRRQVPWSREFEALTCGSCGRSPCGYRRGPEGPGASAAPAILEEDPLTATRESSHA